MNKYNIDFTINKNIYETIDILLSMYTQNEYIFLKIYLYEMPRVKVYIYLNDEVYEIRQLNVDTYQDIITILIGQGMQSGKIRVRQCEIINYNGPITLTAVNYIIPKGGTSNVTIRTTDGTTGTVIYNTNGTFRDIYNQMIARGYPLNSKIIKEGKLMNLDDLVSPHELAKSEMLHLVSSKSLHNNNNTISIFVPIKGQVDISVTFGITTIREIMEKINSENKNFRLAKVTCGAYDAYIYNDGEIFQPLEPLQRLYLVPDYETLFAGYTATIQ